MSVFTRFKVNALQNVPLANGKSARFVVLQPVACEPFGSATPNGEIKMVIHPEEAFEQFQLGKEFDVTFAEHWEPEQAPVNLEAGNQIGPEAPKV